MSGNLAPSNPSAPDTFKAWVVELTAHPSERAAVIVGSAALDELLKLILLTQLLPPEKSKDELFEANGSLSSFNNRIVMARRLKLISGELAEMLDQIRIIRNHYAHQLVAKIEPNSKVDKALASLFTRIDRTPMKHRVDLLAHPAVSQSKMRVVLFQLYLILFFGLEARGFPLTIEDGMGKHSDAFIEKINGYMQGAK